MLYFLSDNDEVLLVADDRQNIYNREVSWINESMKGYGYKFKGAWGSLHDNMRQKVFPELIIQSYRFYDMFLKEYFEKNPDKSFGEFHITPPKPLPHILQFAQLFWKDLDSKHKDFEQEILYAYKDACTRYKANEIVILVSKKEEVKRIAEYFENMHIPVEHTLNKESKLNFSNMHDTLKLSTIYSYKGMENRAIIYLTSFSSDIEESIATYIALTRAQEYIYVLNRSEKYKDYGAGWQQSLT